MPNAEIPLYIILPDEFEKLDYVKKLRKSLVRKIRKDTPTIGAVQLDLTDCTKRLRCDSGLCPTCVRLLRRKLIRFCHDQSLGNLPWVALTVRAPQWDVSARDNGRIHPNLSTDPLAILDTPEIKNMIATLRRRHHSSDDATGSPFICVGSVESSIKTINNVYQPKSFHVHLMVSGLAEEVINDVAARYFSVYRTPSLVNPYWTEAVIPGWDDFASAMTYAYKQPYIKKSFANARSVKPAVQKPKPAELLEMASILGPHRCTDRLLLVGMKFENGTFRLTPNVITQLERYIGILRES